MHRRLIVALVAVVAAGLLTPGAGRADHAPDTPPFYGSNPSSAPTIGIEANPSGNGYFTLDAVGGVFTHGDAKYRGSLPGLRANDPSIGFSPTVDLSVNDFGTGYWILDRAGGIFTFGDARFRGSVPGLRNRGIEIGPGDIVDLAPVGDRGYYLLDEHGGVFAFGDVRFHGSIPGLRQQGIEIGRADPVAIVPRGTSGYWILDAAGGVFAFGSAPYYGSLPERGNGHWGAVAMEPATDGRGFTILSPNGILSEFGSAGIATDDQWRNANDAVDLAVHPKNGYWVAHRDGSVLALKEEHRSMPMEEGVTGEKAPEPGRADALGDVDHCEGDIERASAVTAGDAVKLHTLLACPTDPESDHRWTSGLTGIVADIDVDGDRIEDFTVTMAVFSDGYFHHEVWDEEAGAATCDGLAHRADDWLGTNFESSCIGGASSWRIRFAMVWDSDPNGSEPVSIDLAPNDQSFWAPSVE